MNTDRVVAIENAITSFKQIVEMNLQTCVHCVHFTETNEICDVVKQRPPAKIIAFGCEQFDNGTPF